MRIAKRYSFSRKQEEVICVIVLKNISKNLQKKVVLNNISFHVSPRENVGIVGQNGAGKTTLLNTIAGILKPDSGFLRVGGAENALENYQVLKNIVYVSGTKKQLWEELRVKDSFEHCVKMYQIPIEEAKKRYLELEKVFEIEVFLNEFPKNLSLGERMRCELCYAFLVEPELLLLDEAMIGLDISVKHKIMQYLEKVREEKKMTIIYTSHNLIEIEKLCDRILVMDEGRMIFDGSVKKIMEEYSPSYHLEIKVDDMLPDFEDLPLDKISIENDVIRITYNKQKIDTAQILRHIQKRSKLLDVRMFEPDLEGTIKKIYKGVE